jgi:hypothetical protein
MLSFVEEQLPVLLRHTVLTASHTNLDSPAE